MRRERGSHQFDYLTEKDEHVLKILHRERRKEQRVFVVFAMIFLVIAAYFLG